MSRVVAELEGCPHCGGRHPRLVFERAERSELVADERRAWVAVCPSTRDALILRAARLGERAAA